MNATPNAGCSADELTRYQKFVCYRVDGKDKPAARYFVGDYAHDPHAWVMACSYATTCGPDFPAFSRDLAADLLAAFPGLAADPKAKAVLDRLAVTLGLPAGTAFEESPLYRLMQKYATPATECPR